MPANKMDDVEDNSTGYAPRSPDLSSFYPPGPTQAASDAPQLQPQLEEASPGTTSHMDPIHQAPQARYKLQPPSYGYGSSSAASNPYQSAQRTQRTPGAAPHSHQHPTPNLQSAQAWAQTRLPASQPSSALRPDHDDYVAYETYTPPIQSHENSSRPLGHGLQTRTSPRTRRKQLEVPGTDRSRSAAEPSISKSPVMPPRKAAAPPPPPPPAVEPSPVKTKFPTARIKRIMQADEEVGKVAQQTPIAVGKALELFMIQLVSKSADIAKEKGSKRVTAPMLKQVVEADEQWDFLREIVSRVENEKEGSKAKSKGSESDEDMEEPKRKGRGRRWKNITF